jgi:hypothetical protein
MSRKTVIMVLMTIGSIAGAYVPVLLGADGFSMTSLAGSTAGGILGIWLGLKFF